MAGVELGDAALGEISDESSDFFCGHCRLNIRERQAEHFLACIAEQAATHRVDFDVAHGFAVDQLDRVGCLGKHRVH